MQLHWDGNNDSVDERNLSASLGTGVTPVTIDHDRLQRLRNWIWTQPPPAYPYAIDRATAARGQRAVPRALPGVPRRPSLQGGSRFQSRAGRGTEIGTVVPLEAIGTDPYSPQLVHL